MNPELLARDAGAMADRAGEPYVMVWFEWGNTHGASVTTTHALTLEQSQKLRRELEAGEIVLMKRSGR